MTTGEPNARPRIAMVSTHGYVAAIPPLGAADTGGQVVYVLELSKKLTEFGFDVDIWTRRFEDQPEIDVVSEHVRVVRAPCGGPDFIAKEYLARALPEWSKNALDFIAREKLAYTFANSHYWDAGVAAEPLAQALGIPHVHTPHSLGIWKRRQMENDFPGDRESFEERYNFGERIRSERALYAACPLVIATTPEQVDVLTRSYGLPADKCRMIPPGYDDTRFFPLSDASRRALRQRLGLEGKVVLALGRLALNKGYDLLIDAFQLVAARFDDARLYLAVGGTNLSEREHKILSDLRAQAERLGLGDRVRFASFIPDEQLADYYRAADAFVMASRYEPFGMAAVEAMACGTPTIVTVHGGLWRALTFGRHVLFADPFDREDLGICMVKVFRHHRLRARMSRMGAHRARSLFTWTGVAQELIATIEQRESDVASFYDAAWDDPWQDSE
jgi:mannosylfructose-phosphate synthase